MHVFPVFGIKKALRTRKATTFAKFLHDTTGNFEHKKIQQK
jgi:hypothetical protein